MNDQIILSERDSTGVAIITLNKPDIHNAFNDVLISKLTNCLDDVAADESVRVVLLQSRGKSFSAGADLKWMKSAAKNSSQENEEDALKLADLFHRLDTMPMPTVARVQGSAFAGGLGLIACCDIAIGVTQAKFAVTEVKLGLIPSVISPYLAQAIGPGVARRLFQTAEVFEADEAKLFGLLHEVVDSADLDKTVYKVINSILGNAAESNKACKKLINELGSRTNAELRAETGRRIALIRSTDEAQEGISAFFERRSPRWAEKRN